MARFYKHGIILASTTPAAMPDVYFGYQAWLKPRSANAAVITIGSTALSEPGSTVTDATSGFELGPSETFILQGPGNLSSYYLHSTSTGQILTYMCES